MDTVLVEEKKVIELTVKKYESDGFPKIFKGNNGDRTYIQIIYRDHMEWYWLNKSYYDCDGQKFDPYKEVEMCEGANAREVKAGKVFEHTITQAMEIEV